MHVYDVLRRPLVTEKSTAQTEAAQQYTFEVDLRANKIQVKDAVETAFNVTVLDVQIINVPAEDGPRRACGGHQETRPQEGRGEAGPWQHHSVLRGGVRWGLRS